MNYPLTNVITRWTYNRMKCIYRIGSWKKLAKYVHGWQKSTATIWLRSAWWLFVQTHNIVVAAIHPSSEEVLSKSDTLYTWTKWIYEGFYTARRQFLNSHEVKCVWLHREYLSTPFQYYCTRNIRRRSGVQHSQTQYACKDPLISAG